MLVTALGMIDMGTTAIVDISQVSHTPEHSDACIRGAAGVRHPRGLRLFPRRGTQARNIRRTSAGCSAPISARRTSCSRSRCTVSLDADGSRWRARSACRSSSTSSQRPVRQPLCSSAAPGCLRPGDAVHPLHASERSGLAADQGHRRARLDLRRRSKWRWATACPRSRRRSTTACARASARDHRATIAQDIFTLMRSTFILAAAAALQRRAAGEQNAAAAPDLPRCARVRHASQGARCANIDRKVGTLTPGKEADIVMLRADRLDVWPLNNAPMAVVNLMNPSHVDTVFIAGKVQEVARQPGRRRCRRGCCDWWKKLATVSCAVPGFR